MFFITTWLKELLKLVSTPTILFKVNGFIKKQFIIQMFIWSRSLLKGVKFLNINVNNYKTLLSTFIC